MKILGIIPARAGSKGIKNKNIIDLGGKPLISWTIKSAIKSNLDEIIVSTDSIKIKNVSIKNGCKVPFLRPKHLSKDNSKTVDVAIHAINFYKKKNIFFDAIMILQPTCPFRSIEDINKSIKILKENKKYDSVISIQKVDSFHPARMKIIKNNKIQNPLFSKHFKDEPRQKLAKIFIRSGLIYLSKIQNIYKNKFQGKNCYPLITPHHRSINIDSHFDLEIARFFSKKF